MDIDDVFLTKVMLASLESVRCWLGVCLFYGMALLALGWSCTGLGVTVAVRRVPVLRHAQRTGTQAYFVSKVFVASAGRRVAAVAAAGAVGLVWTENEMACLTLLPSRRWSDSMKVMLRQALVALYRILWRYLKFSSSTWECSSSWTRLSACPLRADSAGVQACRKLWCAAVAVGGHARCCGDRCIGVQFLNKVNMSVVATTGAVLEQGGYARCCDGGCVGVLQSRKLWRFRSCRACRCLLAQFISGCGRPVIMQRLFWCSSWTRSSSCPLRADSWGPDEQKTVLFHSCSSRQGGGRPCDQAATFAKWKCHRFSSSPDSVDIPVVQQICLWRRCLDGRGTGFSAVLTFFFALLRLCRS